MFAKLLKYEFRSNATTCSILSLCVLGVSVLGGFGLRYLISNGSEMPDGASVSASMALVAVFFSLFAYVAAVYVMQLVRFYKNKFTDEGYLTFTLPVNVHQIFLSSALSLLLWTLISGLVLALCILIMYLFATVGMDWMNEIYYITEPVYEDIYPDGYGWVLALTGISITAFGVILPLSCLTVGASIAKKHKILAAFGIYYGISVVLNWIQSILMLSSVFESAISDADRYMELMMEQQALTAAIQLLAAVGGYFLSTWLMKRKLNLN